MENDVMCELHQVPMKAKSGEYGTFWSHIIPNVGFCDGKKIKPFKPQIQNLPYTPAAPSISREPVNQETPAVDWDAKDRQSMSQTAMKSASEIVAAMLNAGVTDGFMKEDIGGAVKDMANQFYKQLKVMKADDS